MINSYLNQLITLKAKSGYDAYGATEVKNGIKIKARVQGKQKRLISEKGEEMVSDLVMFVDPGQVLVLNDIIVFGGSNFQIARIDEKRGLTGSSMFKKAYLIKTEE